MSSQLFYQIDRPKTKQIQENRQDTKGTCPCCGCVCKECTHTNVGECCYLFCNSRSRSIFD